MRSNTYPTQKAVYALLDFIREIPFSRRSLGDTVVDVRRNVDIAEQIFSVTVFDRLVMQVRKEGNEIVDIYVFSGFYYDADGNPTRTVRERLNGLLDTLGEEGIIPLGVRVIMDKEYNMCYLALNDDMVALNKHYCDMIGIKPYRHSLIFGALDPTRDQKEYSLVHLTKQEA